MLAGPKANNHQQGKTSYFTRDLPERRCGQQMPPCAMKRHPIRGDAQANLLFTISNEHADTRTVSTKLCLFQMHSLDFQRRQRTGGARRDRTDDLMLAKHALSQLSYGPNCSGFPKGAMVGPGRLELPTSRLSGVRSNHLSYGPPQEGPRANRSDSAHKRGPCIREERETKTAVSRAV